MNELQDRGDRLLAEPWLERDLEAVEAKVATVRARQRRMVAAGVGILVLVLLAGAAVAGRPRADDGTGTLHVADVPVPAPVHDDGDATTIVFLRPELTPADEARFRAEVVADPDVSQAWWTSSETAMDRFSCLFADDPQMIESVTADILPASVPLVIAAGADPVAFRDRMRARPEVMEVVTTPGPGEVAVSGTSLVPRLESQDRCESAFYGEPLK